MNRGKTKPARNTIPNSSEKIARKKEVINILMFTTTAHTKMHLRPKSLPSD